MQCHHDLIKAHAVLKIDKFIRQHATMQLICEVTDKYGYSHLVLAHRIRISEVLPWDRNSYPMLSHEGCTLVVSELTHMVFK